MFFHLNCQIMAKRWERGFFFHSLCFIWVGACFFYYSCRSDRPSIPLTPQIIQKGKGVLVTCEGNFMSGNASISYYDRNTQSVVEDLYQQVNQQGLGDVCQSLYATSHDYYLVVNNSGKIIKVNKTDFRYTGEIAGLTSPRYFLPVSRSKAYVSDLYANAISIVDLVLMTKVSSIPLPGWTEEMLMHEGIIYVTNYYSSYLYLLNPSTDQIIDSILLSYGANSITEDKYGRLWVACAGKPQQNIPGIIYCIYPATREVIKQFPLQLPLSPHHIRSDGEGNFLYFIAKDLWKMHVDSNTLPSTPLLSGENKNFYSVGVDPTYHEIFVCDAMDYIQKGTVYRMLPDGTMIDTFRTGIIPGNVYFE